VESSRGCVLGVRVRVLWLGWCSALGESADAAGGQRGLAPGGGARELLRAAAAARVLHGSPCRPRRCCRCC
jgi:hypothetical protein